MDNQYIDKTATNLSNVCDKLGMIEKFDVVRLWEKVDQLSNKVDANVNLMDDVLQHANSVLTIYVGLGFL